MSFLLPAGLPADAARELEQFACVAGGPDNMPWPTARQLEPGRLTLRRPVDESGYVLAPWEVEDLGRLMTATATLMERATPYRLALELARGKVNQVRNQLADWRAGGLAVPTDLDRQVAEATKSFGRAATAGDPAAADRLAADALARAARAAEELTATYAEQVFAIRHQRQPKLDTALACRLGPRPPTGALADAVTAAFNSAAVPMPWSVVEAEEATYRWDDADALIDWAAGRGLAVTAGPLIDFSSAQLPAWLWLWENDLPSMATFMAKFVEAAVRRYRGRVRRWQLCAASNCANVLHLSEDELLGLTYRLAEAARQIDPSLDLIVGVAQPWGEYMALEDRTHSPFIFADTLIRSGLNPAAVDVELVMGVTGRGSYCRDVLEASRMLDLYALLGVPLRVTLGYPAAAGSDADADPELRAGLGRWHAGYSPAAQAEWAAAFGALAVCKPTVQGVTWAHVSDAEPHQFPHCGLAGADGQPRPALDRLRELREKHLA